MTKITQSLKVDPYNPAYLNEKGNVLSILGTNLTMDDNVSLRLGICFFGQRQKGDCGKRHYEVISENSR